MRTLSLDDVLWYERERKRRFANWAKKRAKNNNLYTVEDNGEKTAISWRLCVEMTLGIKVRSDLQSDDDNLFEDEEVEREEEADDHQQEVQGTATPTYICIVGLMTH